MRSEVEREVSRFKILFVTYTIIQSITSSEMLGSEMLFEVRGRA